MRLAIPNLVQKASTPPTASIARLMPCFAINGIKCIKHAVGQAGILHPRERLEGAEYVPMTNSKHKRDVAGRLQLTIEALELKQVEVAATLGISLSKLGNWLRGDAYPNEFLMTVFCERYGVTMDWLYRGLIFGLPKEMADGLAKAKAASPEEPTGPERLAPGKS